jgi:transcriptional regulator with XRE-family HTH domain
MTHEALARKLRILRAARGITLAEAEELTGVTRETLGALEHGQRGAYTSTLEKIARGYGVTVSALLSEVEEPEAELALAGSSPGKVEAPREAGRLEEERRAQEDFQRDLLGRFEGLWGWKKYLSRRLEWCEKVLQKSPEESFNNPFLSLDTAIQWAIYVGVESAQLRDAVRTEVRSYTEEVRSSTDADSEIVGELHALLDRFVAVDDTINMRVKAMMDEAGLTDEDKEQRLRLIPGSAA